MKFQNPSFNFFLNGRKDKPNSICSPLFQSWGHKLNVFSTCTLKGTHFYILFDSFFF